jgi:hypothetical protein
MVLARSLWPEILNLTLCGSRKENSEEFLEHIFIEHQVNAAGLFFVVLSCSCWLSASSKATPACMQTSLENRSTPRHNRVDSAIIGMRILSYSNKPIRKEGNQWSGPAACWLKWFGTIVLYQHQYMVQAHLSMEA